MLAQIHSFILQGVEALSCEVEVDVATRGLSRTSIVGLPDAAVRESVDRVRTAIINCGYEFNAGPLVINLAPADLRKEGPVYDLPIALGILIANRTIQGTKHKEFMIAGELALDGRLRPVKGVISMAMRAKKAGVRGVIVPTENAAEAAAAGEAIEVYAADSLSTVVGFLNEVYDMEPVFDDQNERDLEQVWTPVDFADVKGQEVPKRALMIAAAGAHNALMIGPAGTGKSMMAKALAGILPPMSRDEALETSSIYSAAGLLDRDHPLMQARPVRSPHHTASSPAIVGGGSIPQPGEVSLAHHGVLFLDELPEFNRKVLETMRQPLEDGYVTISRATSTIRFPACFMLIAAMNPTPGGDFATDELSQREMDRYLSRISGPLVDRIDIHVEVPRIDYDQLAKAPRGTGSEEMRAQVIRARELQSQRNGGPLKANATISGRELDQLAPIDEQGQLILKQAMGELGLSARAYDKVRRVSRTIADLEQAEVIAGHHVAEAVQYRLLDRKI